MSWMIFFLIGVSVNEGIECELFTVKDTLALGATPGHLSPEGLTFVCGMVDEDGRERLYEWTRRSLKASWKGPILIKGKVNESEISTDNMQPTITADYLTMVFVRNSDGSWEDNKLWITTRESSKKPFDNVRLIDELNIEGSTSYPFISADGSRLYYTTDEGMMVADYNKIDGRFGKPEKLKLPWDEVPLSSWFSADELLMIASCSDGGVLYCAKRVSKEEPFVEAGSLSLPDELEFVSSPSLDPRGELYMYSSVTMDTEVWDMEYEEEADDGIFYSDEYYYSVNMILRLVCQGDK